MFLCVGMCASVPVPAEARRQRQIPGAEFAPNMGAVNRSRGPLGEQQASLATKPSPQPRVSFPHTPTVLQFESNDDLFL